MGIRGKACLVAALLCRGFPLFGQIPDSFIPNPNNVVYSFAAQPDGKVIVGGFFSYIGGQFHGHFGRVNSDGSLDPAFAPDADDFVSAIVVQPDGGIVIGGNFGTVSGQPRMRLARVSADGVVDPGFNPGADSGVWSLALQPDGKILVGGFFGHLGGQPRSNIGRLNPDGSVDAGFNPGADNGVMSLVVQPDGKILVGGWFQNLGGTNRAYLGRLNTNGTIDTNFNAPANNFVNCLALQPDGKILAGGSFTNLAGQPRNYIGRLNTNGTIDATFNPGANDAVFSLAIQTDGGILAGGYFTNLAGAPRNYIGRITNGVIDPGFNAGTDGAVLALGIQADGKVLVGGGFNNIGPSNRTELARLNNTSAATQSLTYGSSRITWSRGGTSPEILSASFDYSSNGTVWTGLAAPARISGGWQLTNVPGLTNMSIRARGFLTGGQGDTSSWFVETNIGPVAIDQQPLSRTNLAATLAAFTVRVGGGTAPTYHWRKGGTNLVNGTNISGATSSTLVLSNVFGGDSGAYSVVVSDTRSVTSQVATLTVLDPYITSQPTSLTNDALTPATFSVGAVGQAPVTNLWLKNGTPLTDTSNISGSHSNILTLSYVSGFDDGQYVAVVSDASGSVTSVVATLTVRDPTITVQPTSQNGVPGGSASFFVGITGSPSTYQWRQNGTPVGPNSALLTLSNLTAADAGFYDVVVTNPFGVATSAVVTLTVNYAAADALNPAFPAQSPNFDSLAIQGDGSIIVGGNFFGLGCPIPCIASDIARLGPDGTIDISFYTSANDVVQAVGIQTNGGVVIGGAFTIATGYSSYSLNHLARFDSTGHIDPSFNPGPNGLVRCLAFQADGSIIVGGDFLNLGGQPHSHIGRLSPGGTLDPAFNPGVPNVTVTSLAVQPDGKILVGGNFQSIAGQTRYGIARLYPSGTIDTNFNPGQEGEVDAIAVQPDGKIIVGGMFAHMGGAARANLARLSPDGTLDSSFNIAANNSLTSIALQLDGRIVVGGSFTALGGAPLNGLARLNADGSLDFTFNPGGGPVSSLAIRKDGGIVVGGSFTTLGGQSHNGIGRLINSYPAPAIDNVTFDNSSVTWVRSGPSTEFWRVSFEASTNGSSWTPLGDAFRIPGDGWQLTGLTIPSNSIVRTRGFAVGGNWFVENVVGLPVITVQPTNLGYYATTTATFSASGYGGTPLSYQWLKNGNPLTNGGNISGAQTTVLTISNVLGADAGVLSLVFSNASGSVTSSVANLTVIDPWLTSQPASQAKNAGQSVTFSAPTLGTTPLHFSWFQNGTNLSDGGNISGSGTGNLNVTNLTGFNAGNYEAIVSNIWGSVTSVVATLTVADPIISTNPVSRSIQVGQSVTMGVFAFGAQPLIYQWRTNGLAVPGATNALLVFTNGQAVNAGRYDVVVSSVFGSRTSSVATLSVNATTLDPFNPGAGQLSAFAIQPDGKILLGTGVLPKTSPNPFRVNPDGSPDPAFVPGLSGTSVNCLAVQTDGKILVAGSASVQQRIVNLWRLNTDGSVDSGFTNQPNAGPNGSVTGMALQPDGKILLAGRFTSVNGQAHTNLARLNTDGTVDTNFNASASGTVFSVTVQPDGSILVGGGFGVLDGAARNNVGRLHSDGTLDTNFVASALGDVWGFVVQPDGKILVSGNFYSLDGVAHQNIGRLNTDGTLDTNFTATASTEVRSVALQTDGKVVLGFDGLSRWNADGTQDLTFTPVLNGQAYALGLQTDGSLLVGGAFSTIGGVARTNIGRLINTGQAVQGLAADATSVSWSRSGTGPEVWRTTFDYSSNGVDWTGLGAGQRIAGGWELTNLNLPVVRNLRARGFLTGGIYNASSWFVETVTGGAVVALQPLSITNNANTTARFSASGSGDPPLGYYWLKGGFPLADGGKISGSRTPTLTLSNVFGADAGGYSLVVSNASGSSTSSVATLTVREPIITNQPLNQLANAGDNASFTVGALGSAPFGYQWSKNGTNISGANAAILTLNNVTAADTATYSVVVSTPYGSASSSNATLTVNLAVPDPFNPGTGDQVRLVVPQTDGKILVSFWASSNSTAPSQFLIRLNTNGSVDSSFNPGITNGAVWCTAIQPDGQILVGGTFSTIAGQPQACIARLTSGGTLDPTFHPSIAPFFAIFQPGVASLVVQPDGRILVGGFFDSLAGGTSSNICRLNIDGSLDTNFLCNPNDEVRTIALQADGGLLIGGDFTNVNGLPRNHLARLTPGGNVDPLFNPGTDNHVFSLVIQPDGKILVSGQFTGLALPAGLEATSGD
jgi:uncharacterized delta-60 repeat protein